MHIIASLTVVVAVAIATLQLIACPPIPEKVRLAKYAHIPLTKGPGHRLLYVQVSINGGQPCWMCVDSGSAISVVDTTAARVLKLEGSRRAAVSGIGSASTDIKLASTNSIAIGRVECRDVLVALVSLEKMIQDCKHDSGIEIVGLLGADILDRLGAVIDYKQSLLTLENDLGYARALLEREWKLTAIRVDGNILQYNAAVHLGVTVTGQRLRILRPVRTFDFALEKHLYVSKVPFFGVIGLARSADIRESSNYPYIFVSATERSLTITISARTVSALGMLNPNMVFINSTQKIELECTPVYR